MFRQINRQSQDKVAAVQDDRVPPFRSISDFISDATWNIPNLSDLERFNNRIINNLIYYQTNYFIFGIALMLLIGISNLRDCLTSLGVLIVFLFAFTFISTSLKGSGSTPFHRYPNNIKTAHMILYFVIISGVIYMGMCYIYSLMFLTLSILIPILGWYLASKNCVFAIFGILIHAMLRKRNIANKVTNQLEKIKLGKTPMGKFLAALGMDNL